MRVKRKRHKMTPEARSSRRDGLEDTRDWFEVLFDRSLDKQISSQLDVEGAVAESTLPMRQIDWRAEVNGIPESK